MDVTVVGKGSCRVEGEHERLILSQITGGVKGIGIAGHGMRGITHIRPHDRRSFGDHQRRRRKGILAILLNNLHFGCAGWCSSRWLRGSSWLRGGRWAWGRPTLAANH